MIVYRICHPDYAHDLSGYGSSINGARWNERGFPVLYTATTSSLTILEFLVHIRGIKGNISYKLLTIDMNSMDVIEPSGLNRHWVDDQKPTQRIGTEWLKSKGSIGLKVPSAHNPLECNILWNPRHPKFNPQIVRSDYYWYDGRLILQT
ncbi:MAG: RES family NAD+ phosphorylase [Cyclobacteriaceae bacterium]